NTAVDAVGKRAVQRRNASTATRSEVSVSGEPEFRYSTKPMPQAKVPGHVSDPGNTRSSPARLAPVRRGVSPVERVQRQWPPHRTDSRYRHRENVQITSASDPRLTPLPFAVGAVAGGLFGLERRAADPARLGAGARYFVNARHRKRFCRGPSDNR